MNPYSALEDLRCVIERNEQLEEQIKAMIETEGDVDKAQTIVALREEVAKWKSHYEFAIEVMKQGKTQ